MARPGCCWRAARRAGARPRKPGAPALALPPLLAGRRSGGAERHARAGGRACPADQPATDAARSTSAIAARGGRGAEFCFRPEGEGAHSPLRGDFPFFTPARAFSCWA
eukprot:scaffold67359_cov30-Tisochrysis_lutea.AAC.1